jgi:dolichyl-phosphate-mannose--protein O-mannosyl transferase
MRNLNGAGLAQSMRAALNRNALHAVALLLVCLAATLTFGTRYWQPESLFWDENYHVASAHKQLAGVMYMENHPPLGKMLIALGEFAVGANAGRETTALLHTDHVSQAQLPPGYSFKGVRLASVLGLILSVPLLYLLLFEATRSRAVALCFALLLPLDNAWVTHGRAAMLEGVQLPFVLLALWLFARSVRSGAAIRLHHYLLLGASIGLALAVKLNAAPLLLLPPVLLGQELWRQRGSLSLLHAALRSVSTGSTTIVGVGAVFLGVFWLQIALSPTVIEGRTYKASPEYIAALRQGQSAAPSTFMLGLRDHLRYIAEYSDGVPRFDACKPGENGSPALHWPLGGKTINYRWAKVDVDGQTKVDYTYLVTNPLVWLPVLAGMLLSFALLLAWAVFGLVPTDRRLLGWIALMSALYLGYMVSMLQVERVMYLYHYLLPLIFGIVNLALVFAYVFRESLARGDWHPRINLAAYAGLVLAGFLYFAPLGYGWPLDENAVERRAWLQVWKLEPVR